MDLVLDLYNFDSPTAEGSKYVLTSPRSLEACSRLHIKPVQLLPKSLSDFAEENTGKSSEFIQILFNEWEEKRINNLKRCRRERDRIIMEKQITKSKRSKEADKKRNSNSNQSKYLMQSSCVNENNPIKGSRSPLNSETSKSVDTTKHSDDKKISAFAQETPSCVVTSAENSVMPQASLLKPDQHIINITTPRSERSRPLNHRNTDKLRSKSVETQIRSGKLCFAGCSPRNSLGFSSQVPSGYVTPQIQRDKRLVEFMKEKRKREDLEEKVRHQKMLEWSEERKKNEDVKQKESVQRQKKLAAAHARWEKAVNLEVEKRRRDIIRFEEELLEQQLQADALVKSNREKQAKIRLQQLEDRKKAVAERKQQQEKILNTVHKEVQAFQEATETDIKSRLERAERTKLESEMRELEKVKLKNKKQWERFREVQKAVKKKREEEEKLKKELLEDRLCRVEENHKKKVIERNMELKTQCHEKKEKIRQTMENHKRMEKQAEEHMHEIAEHKNELLRHAKTTALQNSLNKSKRAQQMRIASEETWKKNRVHIEEKDKEHVLRTLEDLETKENKAKKHIQLKEAALEFSRVQAKLNEVEREVVKRKSSNFSQMAQQAQLMANVGRGPRSSFVNFSTIKLG